MRNEKTLPETLSRAQHAAAAAEPALGFGPEVPSSGVPSSESQTRAAREPPTRNTYPHEFPLTLRSSGAELGKHCLTGKARY